MQHDVRLIRIKSSVRELFRELQQREARIVHDGAQLLTRELLVPYHALCLGQEKGV
jgi:hypothetical protein